ncbi:MAG: hypothetical protein ACI8Z7_000046 [Candidatus Nanohaloarchaea archaeon]|jgi:hypothetical protein
MASSFDTLMGSVFSALVLAGIIGLSFYGALSPIIVGAGLVLFIVIWYLMRGSDIEPMERSRNSMSSSPSNPPPGDEPEMDGPSLDDTTSGSAGSGDPVLNHFQIQTRGNIDLKEGISTSDIIFKFDIIDNSGDGLKEIDIGFPAWGASDSHNLQGKDRANDSVPLDKIVGKTELREGEYPFEIRIIDNDGNTTTHRDSFPVSNKNGGGEGTSMPPGSVNWEKFHSEAQKEEQQFQKAIKELGQYKNDLDEEEETVQYLLNEAKDILRKIHDLDEEFVKIESASIGRNKTESQIDQMKVEIQEINKELKDFQAKLAHEVEVESNDEKLLNQIQELEQGLENEIGYMNKQLNNL